MVPRPWPAAPCRRSDPAEVAVTILGARGLRRTYGTRDVLKDSSPTLADWGKACSPLVLDDVVVVTGGADQGPSLLAYSKQTGELAWKSDDETTARKSYSSPLLTELCGVPQIVFFLSEGWSSLVARPKSPTLISMSLPRKRLPSLRSR